MSFTVVPPIGQYYPDKLINICSNRWSFNAELGVSRTTGPWRLEVSAGAWFFTDNDDFFGGQHRSQDPVTTLQAHLVYTFKASLWLALDATWYGGGKTHIDSGARADFQNNTRLGATLSIPLNRHQSIKAAISTGVATRIGGDFTQVNLFWQYAWF
jgi:hypothetical protein